MPIERQSAAEADGIGKQFDGTQRGVMMAGLHNYHIGPWASGTVAGQACYMPPAGAASLLDLRNIPRQSVPNHGDGVGNGFFSCPSDVTLPSEYTLVGSGGSPSDVTVNGTVKSAWQSLFGVTLGSSISTLQDCLAYTLGDGSDPDGIAGPKPLIPGQWIPQGEVRIDLADHSIIFRRTIDVPRGTSQHARKIRARLQLDLQAIADADQTDKHWRRCLAATKEKYGQKWDDPSEDWLLTAKLKAKGKGRNRDGSTGRSRAEPHETTYTESWPSNGVITSSQDNGWSFWLGTDMVVSSNQLTNTATFTGWSYARMTSAASSSDVYAQAKFISRTGILSSFAVMVRKDSSGTDTFYLVHWYLGDIYSQKVISGTSTSLGTSAQTPAANDVLKGDANGSAIAAYKNGTSVVSNTDTAISSGTYGGAGHYANSHIAVSDDWVFGDLAVATSMHRSPLSIPMAFMAQ